MSQQINLFNPLFLQQKKYFSAVTMVQALGLIVVGIAAFYGFGLWQDRNLARQAAESSRVYDLQKQQFAKATAELNPEKIEAQLDQELKSTEAAVAVRRALLGEIRAGGSGAAYAYSEFLRAFARQTVQGLWLTNIQITEGSGQLNLSGRALQPDLIPVLITRLKEESLMRGRTLEALAISRTALGDGSKRTLVEFTVVSPGSSETEKLRP